MGLYMFRALLTHPQETCALCQLAAQGLEWNTPILVQPTDTNARNIPRAVCEAPPEDEQVMLETCRGP
jgi:hypothetical protein